jgi:hypothetical protein
LFIHAAANMARLLAAAERMRDAHLQALAARGIHFDPFAEADAQVEMQKAERSRLPVIQPVKPQQAGPGTAVGGPGTAVGGPLSFSPTSTPNSAAQLGLSTASSSSLFGGSVLRCDGHYSGSSCIGR